MATKISKRSNRLLTLTTFVLALRITSESSLPSESGLTDLEYPQQAQSYQFPSGLADSSQTTIDGANSVNSVRSICSGPLCDDSSLPVLQSESGSMSLVKATSLVDVNMVDSERKPLCDEDGKNPTKSKLRKRCRMCMKWCCMWTFCCPCMSYMACVFYQGWRSNEKEYETVTH